MTPSIDLRIATILRAVQDVIAPAIDETNSLAREQTALVIGQLKLLAAQWSRSDDYARACRADLERSLAGLDAQGGEQTLSAFAELSRTQALNPEHGIEAHYKALMRCADALVRAADQDGEASFRSALRARLLAFSKRQAVRDRSWFALSGFDLRPEELRSIDAIIAEA